MCKRFVVCLLVLLMGVFSAHGAENSPSIDLGKKDVIPPKKQETKKNSPSLFKKKSPKKSRPRLPKDNKGDTEWIYEQKEGC